MYQCVVLVENNCTEWAEVGFLNLPSLTLSQTEAICAYIAVILVTAYAFKILTRFIK